MYVQMTPTKRYMDWQISHTGASAAGEHCASLDNRRFLDGVGRQPTECVLPAILKNQRNSLSYACSRFGWSAALAVCWRTSTTAPGRPGQSRAG